jgi:4a-hydroxytetrahydrobiopterin dehydratase
VANGGPKQKFITTIGSQSQILDHHPDIHVQGPSSITYSWTTHRPRGLSEKDTLMARFCDEVVSELGAVVEGDVRHCVRREKAGG